MNAPLRTDTQPWHKQFWPWFLIGLLAFAICFCSVFIYLAIHNADPVVDENYYQDGLNINKTLEQSATLEKKATPSPASPSAPKH
jgi:hypothetical protein